MYVCDYMCFVFYNVFGVNIDEYDMKVFWLILEILCQCFLLVFDLDNLVFVEGFCWMECINWKMQVVGEKGGVIGCFGKVWWGMVVGLNFVCMYMILIKQNEFFEILCFQLVW